MGVVFFFFIEFVCYTIFRHVDNFMPTFRKQLRTQSRVVRRGLIKQMRKDLIYLLKPKPKFWPNFFWMWSLRKLLHLKPDNINLK